MTKSEVETFLIHAAALLGMGKLCGISISLITAEGDVIGGHCIADGVPKLLLLEKQIDMLGDD
jgi:hypothetical protein